MATDDPFFIAKDGHVWACWLNGNPAVNLGNEQSFWAAAEKLMNDLHPIEEEASVPTHEPAAVAAVEAAPEVEAPEPAAPPTVERSEDRHEVTIVGRLYGSDGSREVTIYDLSTHGCRVEDHSFSRPGSLVTIKIGSVGPVRAVIRWRRNASIGLKFEDPLYPSVMEHIRRDLSLR